MEFAAQVFDSQIAARWSDVLLQFVWQGFVIAGLTSLTLRVLSGSSSQVRYGVTLLSLSACIAFSAVTFCMTDFDRSRKNTSESIVIVAPTSSVIDARLIEPADLTGILISGHPTPVHADQRLPKWRGAIVLIWVFGQLLLTSRLTLGWVALQRIRRRSHEISSDLRLRSTKLAQRIGLRRVPLVLSCGDAGDATAFGFFRSVVLLPAAWVTEMSPAMIEAVLAHEFSHIRNNDTWVNLIQWMVESAFFYHPAVWWLSKQIRIERERCRDAEAVRITGCRDVFARALEHAARHRARSRFSLASNLGDDRMSLLDRINRVLDVPPIRAKHSSWQFGIVVMVPVLMVWNISDLPTIAQESTGIAEPAAVPPTELAKPIAVTPAEELPRSRVKQSNYYAAVAQSPSERNKVSLPKYRISPPDVLLIQAVRLTPKSVHAIQHGDSLRVDVPNAKIDEPIAGSFEVGRDGTVNLGTSYGTINVAGKTIREAEKTITEFLARWIEKPEASVTLRQTSGVQNVAGEHLVGPDGHVNLGIYGTVYVAGMTTEETRAALEKRLSTYFQKPKISVAVLVYNSSYYYLITKGTGLGDNLHRLPVTGNETVLDAIAQVGGLAGLSEKSIWIARPAPDSGGTDQILPVDWQAITRGADAATNYQILPGDRVFISDEATGHVLIQKNTDVESVVEKFNRLVEQKDFDDAIKVARKLRSVHQENAIAIMLNRLADELEKQQYDKGQHVANLFNVIRSDADERNSITKALQKRIDVSFDAVPFEKTIEVVAKAIDSNIVIDPKALKRHAIHDDAVVTLKLYDVSAKNILTLILERFGLTYGQRDGVIFVTSPYLLKPLIAQAYDVHDLLNLTMRDEKKGEMRRVEFDDIIDLITETIDPDSWDDVGGEGSIRAFPKNLSLVISTSQETHDSIRSLLRSIRLQGHKVR